MPTTARLLRRAAGAGLVAVAAAGAAAYVGTRRRSREDEAATAELPDDVRTAIEEGLAAGGQGRSAEDGIVWIPVSGHALLEDVEAAADAPAAAPA